LNGLLQITRAGSTLRVSEKIALFFFTYALVVAWFFPISLGERAAILLLNAVAIGVVFLLGQHGRPEKNNFLSVLRDWLPCVLIVLAYRESGLFLTPDVSHRLDNLFIVWDRALLGSSWFKSIAAAGAPWLGRLMELAYLLVYPFVPMGFAAVYFGRGSSDANGTARATDSADFYWTAVLLAVLASYALFPFFPLTPPRVLFHDLPMATGAAGSMADPSLLRKLNYWVLNRYSVEACIFPSGHVAGAVATALAVRALRPRLGVVFLFAAACITVSTVFGRYHYTADALAGLALGVAGFLLARLLARRSAQVPTELQQAS
jgi:membrane-associated phospholipid phosphatase